MDRWRHLPGYRLEGNVAPFIGAFLPRILKGTMNIEVHDTVIPEFPLRKGTLDHDQEGNLSFNVDCLAFGKDEKTAYLVELKTDMRSIREGQHEYLEAAERLKLCQLVEGVKKLAKASNRKQKYVHLFHMLAHKDIGVVDKKSLTDLDKKSFPNVVQGWTKALRKVKINPKFPKIKVIFIQPERSSSSFDQIKFDQITQFLKGQGDLSNSLAEKLGVWGIVPAGSSGPKDNRE